MSEEFTSNLVSAPKQKRGPADLLGERRTFMRRFGAGFPTPTVEALQRHAERFGTEGVVETAIEVGYGADACTRVLEHCDRVETAEILKVRPNARIAKVAPPEDRVNLLLGIGKDEPRSKIE